MFFMFADPKNIVAKLSDAWKDLKAEALHTVVSSQAHPITKEIKKVEQDIILKLLHGSKRVVWLGIGTGDVTKEILDRYEKPVDLIGVEINPSAAKLAEYTLRLCRGKVSILPVDILDLDIEPKANDLLILDFGTYGNLSEECRGKVLRMIKKATDADGISMLTVMDPAYLDDHLKRYRWDISLGIVDLLKEIRHTQEGALFIFRRNGKEIHSLYPKKESMLKDFESAGLDLKNIQVFDAPYVKIYIISKKKLNYR